MYRPLITFFEIYYLVLVNVKALLYKRQLFDINALVLHIKMASRQAIRDAQVPLALLEHMLEGLGGQALLGYPGYAPHQSIIFCIVFFLPVEDDIDAFAPLVQIKPELDVDIARVLVSDTVA